MARFLVCSVLALGLVGCAGPGGSPTQSPTTGAATPADTPAATLRAHMDLLFGEHTFIVAKLSVAAAGGRKDEYHSYASLLATNGGDLTALSTASMGDTEGAELGRIWAEGNNSFVDYLVASVTHDQPAADGAISTLNKTYVPQLAHFLVVTIHFPSDSAMHMAADQVTLTKALIDQEVAGSYPQMYSELGAAYLQASTFGDAIAASIAGQFADRFPGDAQGKAAGLRSTLDGLLQQHEYLATMATVAAVGGTTAEESSAAAALAASAGVLAKFLGTAFTSADQAQSGEVLGAEDAALLAYAKADDTSRPDRLSALRDVSAPALADFLQTLGGPTLNVLGQVQATVQVVDDQRAKSFDSLASDDRAATVLLTAIGDVLSDAAVASQPAKFA